MLQVQLEEHLSITKLLQNWQHAILIPFRKGNENEWEDQKEGSNRGRSKRRIKQGHKKRGRGCGYETSENKTKEKRRGWEGKEVGAKKRKGNEMEERGDNNNDNDRLTAFDPGQPG